MVKESNRNYVTSGLIFHFVPNLDRFRPWFLFWQEFSIKDTFCYLLWSCTTAYTAPGKWDLHV